MVGPLLGYVAGILLFCLMTLTCVDVIGRYFFNMPVTGGFELTEMMLAALIFFGLPLVTIRNEHVMVDLLDPVTPDWLLRIQHIVSCLVCAVASGYLAWRLWLRASNMAAAGETTDGNPSAQVVGASSGTPPLIVIGAYGTTGTVDPRTFSTTKDGEITADSFNAYLAYKIYNSSPQDSSIDMDDEGDANILQSCYLACS